MSTIPSSLIDTLPIAYLCSKPGGFQARARMQQSVLSHNASSMRARALSPSVELLDGLIQVCLDEENMGVLVALREQVGLELGAIQCETVDPRAAVRASVEVILHL